MERLLLAALGTVLIATTATPSALAKKVTVNSQVTQNQIQKQITPFNLVSLAYRGTFKNQGVGGYNSLLTDVKFGQVSGKDLVRLAIDTGRLSDNTINDSGYVAAVDYQLQNLARN